MKKTIACILFLLLPVLATAGPMILGGSSGSGIPGGTGGDGAIQFNDSGVLGSSPLVRFNDSSGNLNVRTICGNDGLNCVSPPFTFPFSGLTSWGESAGTNGKFIVSDGNDSTVPLWGSVAGTGTVTNDSNFANNLVMVGRGGVVVGASSLSVNDTVRSPSVLTSTNILVGAGGRTAVPSSLTVNDSMRKSTYDVNDSGRVDDSSGLTCTGCVDISTETNLTAGVGVTLTGDILTSNDSSIVHQSLGGAGAYTHANLDSHIGNDTRHLTGSAQAFTGGKTFTSQANFNDSANVKSGEAYLVGGYDLDEPVDMGNCHGNESVDASISHYYHCADTNDSAMRLIFTPRTGTKFRWVHVKMSDNDTVTFGTGTNDSVGDWCDWGNDSSPGPGTTNVSTFDFVAWWYGAAGKIFCKTSHVVW